MIDLLFPSKTQLQCYFPSVNGSPAVTYPEIHWEALDNSTGSLSDGSESDVGRVPDVSENHVRVCLMVQWNQKSPGGRSPSS